jgi:RNA ligase
MIYPELGQIEQLVAEKLVSKRPHPTLPLFIYNYTAAAQDLGISGWSDALCDCRGLILDHQGEIIAKPFKKFWNYSQVLDRISASEDFTVWEKLDGSLGIVCWYGDDLVVATRGSFESDQALWARNHLKDVSLFEKGFTYLCEVIFPENRIVVDYGDRQDMPLLAVMDAYGIEWPDKFDAWPASKARRFDGLTELDKLAELALPGEEGFVVRWASGFRAKIKFLEYCRLHKLITQCSTRTIWELLRSGKETAELIDRVPAEFGDWVKTQIRELTERHNGLLDWAHGKFHAAPQGVSRKDFAEYAKKQDQPGLLFAMLDAKPIEDMCWRIVEPRWVTPFRGEIE